MKDRGLPEDQLARELPNRIALCAGGFGDPGEAEQIVRDLSGLLERGGYCLAFREAIMRGGASAPAARRSEPRPTTDASASGAQPTGEPAAPRFTGRPLAAKYAGRCAVCGGSFPQGAAILYDGDAKRAAHDECGEIRV